MSHKSPDSESPEKGDEPDAESIDQREQAELPVVVSEHQSPSDRIRREIKNRIVLQGQFSITMVMLGMLVMSVLFGLPSLLDLEHVTYWRRVTLVLFSLAPLIGFFAIALSDHMGFPKVVRFLFGFAVWIAVLVPILVQWVAECLHRWDFSLNYFPALLLLFWIPQIIALVAAKVLMKY